MRARNLPNGTRSKTISTAAGDLDLGITKPRTGSFFASLLARRRRIDQALFAVVMEAYVTGTSVRKVDDLVKALGADRRPKRARMGRGNCRNSRAGQLRVHADPRDGVADPLDRNFASIGLRL